MQYDLWQARQTPEPDVQPATAGAHLIFTGARRRQHGTRLVHRALWQMTTSVTPHALPQSTTPKASPA